MSNGEPGKNNETREDAGQPPQAEPVCLVLSPPALQLPVARILRRRVWLPLLLFIATCMTTLLAGGLDQGVFAAGKVIDSRGVAYALAHGLLEGLGHGWKYALPLMTILVCHEAGHFIQARRNGVWASYPHFLPVPLPPLGTLGAVIVMEPRMGNRRALFDIGITGPLAGLVPTLIFCVVGLHLSEHTPGYDQFGDPLLMQWMAHWILGPPPPGEVVMIHPVGFAGWVGLLITALNLLPIGQLDGGHVLYALLRKKAWIVASILLAVLATGVAIAAIGHGYWVWTLMLVLLMIMGPIHPPTGNDNVSLGPVRILLGWLTLAFIPIGLTPTPIIMP